MGNSELEKNASIQREFFNRLAPAWRENGYADRKKLQSLLAPIPLKRGQRVLDIACGAGVLDEYLLSVGLAVDGIDIAENMIEKARKNKSNSGVNYFVADFYTFSAEPYDCLLAFDCYPHFSDKALFEEQAYNLLKDGGILWIFFDQCRQSINSKHSGHAGPVSVKLESAEKEAGIFSKRFNLVYLTDNGESYAIGFEKKSDK